MFAEAAAVEAARRRGAGAAPRGLLDNPLIARRMRRRGARATPTASAAALGEALAAAGAAAAGMKLSTPALVVQPRRQGRRGRAGCC